jgi:hypothetical protein
MAVSGQHAVIVRATDRAYLAWATVALAYAIAFLQRKKRLSVSA